MRLALTLTAALALLSARPYGAAAAAVFVPGEVPDWNQPYDYFPPPFGPGPNPGPGSDPFDAWCGPTSASNLLGHWEDVHGLPTGDGIPFALSVPPQAPLPWPAPPIWHDWNLGSMRPAPGPVPAMDADVGWFMDTNHSGSTARGNAPHVGTYTKDLHVGLAELLLQISVAVPNLGAWNTGTRGGSFALGTQAGGAAATPHASAASAFAEVRGEIDAGHTLIMTWKHWNITPTGSSLAPIPAPDEAQFGGDYYTIASGSPGADPWGNDELWPEEVVEPELNLGHVVTAVGYIPAGDPDDINAPGNPTDWVIVHDNVAATARNVILPLTSVEYASHWVANTNAQPVMAAVPALGGAARGLLLLALGISMALAFATLRRPAPQKE